jgi:hypothetical protein
MCNAIMAVEGHSHENSDARSDHEFIFGIQLFSAATGIPAASETAPDRPEISQKYMKVWHKVLRGQYLDSQGPLAQHIHNSMNSRFNSCYPT